MVVIKLHTKILYENEISIAAKILNNGGIVGIPTETVYGLAANALDGNAVKKIFKAKERPMDNPLIVHISSIDEIYNLVYHFPNIAKKLCDKFWPGPLTIILPKSNKIPNEVSAGLDTVAIRLPSHPLARKLIKTAGIPLAAPSANISGKPSPTSFKHVYHDLNGKIDAIIDGGDSSVGLESTVITLVSNPPKLLRPGGITIEEVQAVLGTIDVDSAVFDKLRDGQTAISPGMKYKHYSPNANIIILNCSSKKYIEYVNKKSAKNVAALCYDEDTPFLNVKTISMGSNLDVEEQANKLFNSLREIDKDDTIDTVYSRCPIQEGVGIAVYNRLIRAAGFEVINIE